MRGLGTDQLSDEQPPPILIANIYIYIYIYI